MTATDLSGAFSLAGLGLTAAEAASIGIGAGLGGGQSFYGLNGQSNGFTTLSGYENAATDASNVNTNPNGAQFGNQQIYNQAYQSAVNSGISPQQAAQYAQTASGGYNPASGLGGYAPTANTGFVGASNLGGLGTTTAAGAGTTLAAPVTVGAGGGGLTAGQIGLGIGAAGAGAGVAAGLGAAGTNVSPGIGQGGSGTGTAPQAKPVGGSSTFGLNPGTIAAAGAVAGGIGSIVKGATGGVSTSAPNPATIAGGILQDEINFAPSVYNTTSQYAPQYAGLQSGLLNQSASSVLGGYSSFAPSLQGIQTGLNAQQAGGNLGLVSQYGSAFTSAFLNANPQLQETQSSLNSLANTPQNPVGQIQNAGAWGSGFTSAASQSINGSQVQAPTAYSSGGYLNGFGMTPQTQVQAGGNSTLGQLNQTAQQQLALGTSISPQEQATVANQVLSNYNSMGRAEDPTAIAGLATGLDTYGQQLLAQREGTAANAAGLTTTANQLGLSAQQSNQQAALSGLTTQANLGTTTNLANQGASLTAQQANLSSQLGLQGLNYEALASSGAQGLSAAQSNQQAQLSNAQYQAQLLQNAAALEQSTGAGAMSSLLNPSQGLTQAYNTTEQGGTSLSNANALSGMYNPFNSAAYGPAYNAASSSNITNATTNAGLLGGGLSLLGNLATSSSFMSSLSGLFG